LFGSATGIPIWASCQKNASKNRRKLDDLLRFTVLNQVQETKMDLSIIIPCYNEAENVPKIQKEFFPIAAALAEHNSLEVIFVDDGSSDETWQALVDTFGNGNNSGVSVRFERHEVNRGLGAAVRTGFAAARGEVIVTTDSDGTYKFSEIPNLLSCLRPGVDIVTASPYHPAGDVAGVPPYRIFLSRGSSTIYRLLVDRHLHTYTALFRAYRRQVIEHVPFESNGYLSGTELLVNGILMGYQVDEYPAVLHVRVFGASKAKLVRTILAHLRFQARVLLHQLRLVPFTDLRKAMGVQE
jgi:dolichol-phosphate mannosyltransferase